MQLNKITNKLGGIFSSGYKYNVESQIREKREIQALGSIKLQTLICLYNFGEEQF